jgi:hypothetical protein
VVLGVQLSKNLSYVEIAIPEGKSAFSNYIFDDKKNDIVWTLIENKATMLSQERLHVERRRRLRCKCCGLQAATAACRSAAAPVSARPGRQPRE